MEYFNNQETELIRNEISQLNKCLQKIKDDKDILNKDGLISEYQSRLNVLKVHLGTNNTD
jgi:hypothetical protein